MTIRDHHLGYEGAALSCGRTTWKLRSSVSLEVMTLKKMITNGPAVSPPTRRTNSFAIAALVCGIVQFSGLWPAGIVAIVLGHRALREIRESGDDGYGLAKAGLVLGYLGIALGVLVVLLLLLASCGQRPLEAWNRQPPENACARPKPVTPQPCQPRPSGDQHPERPGGSKYRALLHEMHVARAVSARRLPCHPLGCTSRVGHGASNAASSREVLVPPVAAHLMQIHGSSMAYAALAGRACVDDAARSGVQCSPVAPAKPRDEHLAERKSRRRVHGGISSSCGHSG